MKTGRALCSEIEGLLTIGEKIFGAFNVYSPFSSLKGGYSGREKRTWRGGNIPVSAEQSQSLREGRKKKRGPTKSQPALGGGGCRVGT